MKNKIKQFIAKIYNTFYMCIYGLCVGFVLGYVLKMLAF